MTLYRQLILNVALMCVLMFVATIAINLYNTRLFLMNQLESHAQDTATSLALSLTPHMQEQDLVMATSMVDAIFDRGYYSHIKLVANDGAVLLEREARPDLADVPDWFIHLVDLRTPQADAQVMAGWNLIGDLFVQSHPGFAYRQLWQTFSQLLFWFTAAAGIVGLLGAAFIHTLLRPLREVEKQAEGICRREYAIQKRIPRTRELRQMVVAMNRMTEKVQSMFAEQSESAERMRELAYIDPLTGLGNRRYFEGKLGVAVRESEKSISGALLLVQINGLKEVNDALGFEAGDALIKAAARVLQSATDKSDVVISRLTGGDFAILYACGEEKQLCDLAARLSEKLAELYMQGMTDSSNVAHIGVALYSSARPASELLAEADQALRAAQSAGPNQWSLYRNEVTAEPAVGRHEWAQRIAGAIEHRNISLFVQPVVMSQDGDQAMHREVFVRIPAPDGTQLAAGVFMPLAEEMNMARGIDRLVVEKLLQHMARTEHHINYAVNLSPGALQDTPFLAWLYDSLSVLGEGKGRLVFEFPEFGVVHELEQLHQFSQRVRSLGHGIALDHFGQAFSNFGYLHSLRPEYVKIDGCYTADIINNRDDQFFVRTLCSIAHSLDVLAIAEMVETEPQWQILRTLKVDGIQGYVVDRPLSLEDVVEKKEIAEPL